MRTALLSVTCLVATSVIAAAGVPPSDTPSAGLTILVDRFLSSAGRPLTSYRALRTLEAETRGGKMRARLTARTSLDPVEGFQYTVVDEDGAGMIRQKVLRAALEAERSLRASGEAERGALTTANYEFTAADRAESGLVHIGIRPRRRDTMLLEGRIVLTEHDADLLRIEGSLIKRPSFWTRRVDVVRRYARIGGVRVPVAMQSIAQVMIVGQSTFSMTYQYESINGEPVERSIGRHP